MVDLGYYQRADVELELLIGFRHTAVPIDYRTRAMIERDRARNEAEAEARHGTFDSEALADWMGAQRGNPLMGDRRNSVFLGTGPPEPT